MLTPNQCRAARAILGWSQEQLEAKSNIAKKTIAEFERGAQNPYERTLQALANALEAGGAQLIPENGGGAGVRLKAAVPRLLSVRLNRFYRQIAVTLAYRGSEHNVMIPWNVIDDLDHTSHETDAEARAAVDRHKHLLVTRCAEAIDQGGEGADGVVRTTDGQFIPRGTSLREGNSVVLVPDLANAGFDIRTKYEVVAVLDDPGLGKRTRISVKAPDGRVISGDWASRYILA